MVGGSERICADIWEKTLGLMWTHSSRLFDMRRIGVKAGSAANNLALTLVPFWALLGEFLQYRQSGLTPLVELWVPCDRFLPLP